MKLKATMNCYHSFLYVPKGIKANYEAADVWKEFTIVEREDTPTAVSDISSADEIIGTEYYGSSRSKSGRATKWYLYCCKTI